MAGPSEISPKVPQQRPQGIKYATGPTDFKSLLPSLKNVLATFNAKSGADFGWVDIILKDNTIQSLKPFVDKIIKDQDSGLVTKVIKRFGEINSNKDSALTGSPGNPEPGIITVAGEIAKNLKSGLELEKIAMRIKIALEPAKKEMVAAAAGVVPLDMKELQGGKVAEAAKGASTGLGQTTVAVHTVDNFYHFMEDIGDLFKNDSYNPSKVMG